MSGNNRNVLLFMKIEMSAVRSLSLVLFERLPPRMILAWTPTFLRGILLLAVGRIGLRRSATRAPGGRLYARGRGLLRRVPALFFFPHAGVGRQCAKLRGSGGRAPSAARRHDLLILQVATPEPDRQAPIQPLLDHYLATALSGVGRLQQLIETIAEPDRVVVA